MPEQNSCLLPVIYKIISEIEYDSVVGTIVKDKDAFAVIADGKTYKVLLAAVTYLKGKLGDKVTIRIPKGKNATFACVDAVIPGEDVSDLGIEEVETTGTQA